MNGTITRFDTAALAHLNRALIGFDTLFNDIEHRSQANTVNYPPYNILKHDENTFEVQVAVAGFSEGEVEVSVKDGNLVMSGDKQPEAQIVGTEYLHQGISARRFIRTFSLADYVEVVDASSRDGILTVRLERKLPEAMKPKTIAITYAK